MSYCQILANKLNGHIRKLKKMITLNNEIIHVDDLWKMLNAIDQLLEDINKTDQWVWNLFKPYSITFEEKEEN